MSVFALYNEGKIAGDIALANLQNRVLRAKIT
jgi:hypothetical protein